MGQINLNDANPAAPSGYQNVKWQAVANPSVLAITAVSDNAGSFEIAFGSAHNCVTGDFCFINSESFPELQGGWVLTKIDATHLVLQGSTYEPGYSSGAQFLAARDVSAYVPIAPSKYSTTFTSVTSVTVTHNLNTLAVIVAVYDSSGNQLDCGVQATGVNTVVLTFDNAQSGSVVVIG